MTYKRPIYIKRYDVPDYDDWPTAAEMANEPRIKAPIVEDQDLKELLEELWPEKVVDESEWPF